jgi:hypothetical protein
MHLTLHH